MSKVLHLTEVTDKLQEKIDALEHKSAEGLAKAAFFVAGLAQQRAPVESGDLRGSVSVKLDGDIYAQGTLDGKDVLIVAPVMPQDTKATIGFYTPYAAKQHEDLTLNHDKSGYKGEGGDGYERLDGTTVNAVAGGQAKYLESVLVEKQSEILRIIAGEMGFDGGDDYD